MRSRLRFNIYFCVSDIYQYCENNFSLAVHVIRVTLGNNTERERKFLPEKFFFFLCNADTQFVLVVRKVV